MTTKPKRERWQGSVDHNRPDYYGVSFEGTVDSNKIFVSGRKGQSHIHFVIAEPEVEGWKEESAIEVRLMVSAARALMNEIGTCIKRTGAGVVQDIIKEAAPPALKVCGTCGGNPSWCSVEDCRWADSKPGPCGKECLDRKPCPECGRRTEEKP